MALYNGKPLHEAVEAFIAEYTGCEIEHDEVELETLGIDNDDMFQFTFDVAGHFGFDECIDGDEIGGNASVWNVTNFVEEYI